MSRKLTEEEKQARRKKREDQKLMHRSNELKARMLDAILALNGNEFVKDVHTSIGADGKFDTEVSIQRTLKEWPYLEDYEVKFQHKRKKLEYNLYINTA